MSGTPDELRARIAAEHVRIQQSLVRCDDCGGWFRDINDHVRGSVTVKAVDQEGLDVGEGYGG